MDLDVAEGQIFALIGPNGAGKTTVFNVLTGLYPPATGTIRFGGVPLDGLAPHAIARRGIARTFQNTEVFRRLSARDNVLVGLHSRMHGGLLGAAVARPGVRREERDARRRAEHLLARLGLADIAPVEAGALPLGQQKRLEIARALAAEPRLLLLDEPAGGLNPVETRSLMDLIARLRTDDGLTILLVEHDMDVVMGLSDRIAVLDHGRKIAEGTPQEITRHPDVVAAYLGSASADG